MAAVEGESDRMTMENGQLKIAVLGNPAVGKTALLNRFLNETFTGRYEESLGDIYSFSTEWDGTLLELEIYDVPGGDEFEEARLKAIELCEAFVLVYSCTDGLSFIEVTYLRDMIFHKKEAGVPMVIVENKIDLARSNWFKGASMIPKILEAAWETPHVRSSARDGSDVSEIFEDLLLEAQKGLRRPSRGCLSMNACNVLQDVLCIIEENNK